VPDYGQRNLFAGMQGDAHAACWARQGSLRRIIFHGQIDQTFAAGCASGGIVQTNGAIMAEMVHVCFIPCGQLEPALSPNT
jgi:hypothetical protein